MGVRIEFMGKGIDKIIEFWDGMLNKNDLEAMEGRGGRRNRVLLILKKMNRND